MPDLSELPSPGEDAADGFYPDPLGGKYSRRWDGSQWTTQVGPQLAAGSDPAKPLEAPTKLCPHCGAQSQTLASKCPHCGKGYAKRSGLKVLAGIVAGGLVLIAGCAGCVALIGSGVDEAEDEAQEHAISKAEFDSIEIGTTQAQVEKRLGVPEDSQEFEQKGFGNNAPQGSSCIYYNETGKDLFEGESFQFCFTEEKLDSKNAY